MNDQEIPFIITLAEGVEISVRRIYEGSQVVAFQLSAGGKYLGEVYPDHGDGEDGLLIWKSYDKIDPFMLAVIGKLIEIYDHA